MVVTKPPMGWNSWNTFGADISDQLIRQSADALVDSGLAAAGYNYVVIDDCWSLRERDEKGCLVPDPDKFPHGMKALADYVHAKGLKFGMYSCAGTKTCARYPSSFEHEFQDAATFAEWGVDFLKYDYCNKPRIDGDLLYKRMGLALATCGRDILFSACNWGVDNSVEWIKSTGAHMWRCTGDIFDSWASIKELAVSQICRQPYYSPTCFNDIDMLVVGMHGKGNAALGGCSDLEYRTHFSYWALLQSPLMIGCDIREMDEATKEILMNPEIIAINQDPACRQPYLILNWDNNQLVWVKPLEGGDFAIGMFNLGDDDRHMDVNWWDMGIPAAAGCALSLRDLWKHEELGTYPEAFGIDIKAHDCLMLRARLVRR